MSDNVLADVFRVLRVSEARFGRFETRAPWGVEVRAREMLSIYAVLDGECVLDTSESEPLLLGAGDVAALLTPCTHTLRSPTPVRLISGRLRCEEARDSHFWQLVPAVVAVRDQTHALPWLEATLHFIVEEVRGSRPGSQTLARRLTELLFVQLLRAHLETQQPTAPGWLSALGDPQIGRALTVLHSEPQKPWTVAALARELGMSRSAFANHFVRLVGEPPVHYLTRVRMEKAAALLREGRAATAEVATRVGYVSDASFCKAFKRTYGQSPGAYRRASRATRMSGRRASLEEGPSPLESSVTAGEAA